MGECYICAFETDKLSNCKCNNLVLHDECQLRIVSSNNNCMKCKVCDTDYINVELKMVETKRLNCSFWVKKEIVAYYIKIIILYGGGTAGCYLLAILPFMRLISFFIFGVSSGLIIVGTSFVYGLCLCIGEELSNGLYIVDKTEVLKIKNEEDINRITDIV